VAWEVLVEWKGDLEVQVAAQQIPYLVSKEVAEATQRTAQIRLDLVFGQTDGVLGDKVLARLALAVETQALC
jgi:hypothetical protein